MIGKSGKPVGGSKKTEGAAAEAPKAAAAAKKIVGGPPKSGAPKGGPPRVSKKLSNLHQYRKQSHKVICVYFSAFKVICHVLCQG